jgi:hemerythrin-like domain-containing protein
LEQENQAGKQLLAEIDSIMKKYLKNAENLAIKKKLLFLIKEARHLYLNHLEKEEEYIFPNLSEFISKEKRKDLVGQFAEIDKHTQRSHQDLIKLAKTINEELG